MLSKILFLFLPEILIAVQPRPVDLPLKSPFEDTRKNNNESNDLKIEGIEKNEEENIKIDAEGIIDIKDLEYIPKPDKRSYKKLLECLNLNKNNLDRLTEYNSQRYHSEVQTDVSMLPEKDQSVIKTALNKEWTNPRYKLRWFVGQAQITPFAKMRQYLMEIKSKEESIENMKAKVPSINIRSVTREKDISHVLIDYPSSSDPRRDIFKYAVAVSYTHLTLPTKA